MGRIFILRLYAGEIVHDILEGFAEKNNIKSAMCFFLGGAEDKSKLVVGPKDGNTSPVEPMIAMLKGVHEGCGVGTLFCDSQGKPKLHMHGSFGRNGGAVTGCMRAGVEIWCCGEVVIFELLDNSAMRVKDSNGFELLET
jgi:predicted DNA-binding protein with PD1-like motif